MDLSSSAADDTRVRLHARFGASVEPWWQRLPALLGDLAARWHLEIGDPVGRGNTSLVVRCRRDDGGSAMLKVTPDATVGRGEAFALHRWAATGRVPLVLGDDPASGALLLEAIPDETPVSLRAGDVALREVAELISSLHRAGRPVTTDGVVSLADRVTFVYDHWIERHGRNPVVIRTVSIDRLRRGRDRARTLAAGGPEPVLLHGDLHPGNVLDGGPGRGLVAIDPRPCVGDAATDAIDWVFWKANPDSWKPRSRQLAALLSVDRDRLWDWSTAFSALLAASAVSRSDAADRIDALLAIAP